MHEVSNWIRNCFVRVHFTGNICHGSWFYKSWVNTKLLLVSKSFMSFQFLDSVITYMLEQYKKDITGYNVVQAVHVEACWPGDPVGETK